MVIHAPAAKPVFVLNPETGGRRRFPGLEDEAARELELAAAEFLHHQTQAKIHKNAAAALEEKLLAMVGGEFVLQVGGLQILRNPGADKIKVREVAE